MEQYKTCTKCKALKNKNLFAKNKLTTDGFQVYCKACQKTYRDPEKNKKYLAIYRRENRSILLPKKRINSKAYYEKNRQKVLDKQKANYDPSTSQKKTSIRRARLQSNPVYEVTKKEVWKFRHLPCFYCGGKGGSIDHVIPVSKGGAHSIGNLVSSCRTCNSSKGNKFITQWKKVRGW